MGSEMTAERAREVLGLLIGSDGTRKFKTIESGEAEAATKCAIAAIADREELIEALVDLVRDDPIEEWIDYKSLIKKYRDAVDLLVRFGRVIKSGDGFKWAP